MRAIVASFVNGTKACGLLVEGGKKSCWRNDMRDFTAPDCFDPIIPTLLAEHMFNKFSSSWNESHLWFYKVQLSRLLLLSGKLQRSLSCKMCSQEVISHLELRPDSGVPFIMTIHYNVIWAEGPNSLPRCGPMNMSHTGQPSLQGEGVQPLLSPVPMIGVQKKKKMTGK